MKRKAEKMRELASKINLKLESKPTNKFDTEVAKASTVKFNNLLKQIEDVASSGYGSVSIKLDFTTELFGVKESEHRFYLASTVVSLLEDEGFILDLLEDFYDARTYLVTWDKDYPQFSGKIGM